MITNCFATLRSTNGVHDELALLAKFSGKSAGTLIAACAAICPMLADSMTYTELKNAFKH